MGLGGVSIWQLLIILLIVVMLFGTKRLKSLGSDLGDAIKGFRKSVNADEDDKSLTEHSTSSASAPLNVEARKADDPAKKG